MFYFIIGFIGVLITSLAQILLKYAAIKKKESSFILFFINKYTIVGYTLMFSVTIINLYIFKYIELKYALVFLPSSFILVLIFSKFMLNENFDKRDWWAYLIILLGVIIFNI
jgi:drug/metabolite transporter (DMT)-like permease